eukprot:2989625-Prymnesium_polylepis.1
MNLSLRVFPAVWRQSRRRAAQAAGGGGGNGRWSRRDTAGGRPEPRRYTVSAVSRCICAVSDCIWHCISGTEVRRE